VSFYFCSTLGKNARISVTIHEKKTVSSSMRATLFPLLLARNELMMNGARRKKRNMNAIVLLGASSPNIDVSPYLLN